MKKIVLGMLLFMGSVFADEFDAPDVIDDWYFINNQEPVVPNNINPPGAIAPDPYKQSPLPYRAWEGAKSGADWALSEPAERAGNRISDGVNKAFDDKVFDPWQKRNNELQKYVDEQKKHVEDKILAIIWYYLSGGNKKRK